MSDDNNESLARLIKLAGERPEIPLSVESRVYHRVHREWQTATAEPNGEKVYKEVHKTWRRGSLRAAVLRWTLPLGVAASAVIAVLMLTPPDTAPSSSSTTSYAAPSASSAAVRRAPPAGSRENACADNKDEGGGKGGRKGRGRGKGQG